MLCILSWVKKSIGNGETERDFDMLDKKIQNSLIFVPISRGEMYQSVGKRDRK